MDTEVNRRKDYGGSLPVENVQELAASHHLDDIPHRYIRPEMELDEILINESLQMPVIDMAKFSTDPSENDHEMEKLHYACKNWGFFQLINHGEDEAINKMKVDTEDFFKLPLQEKMAYAQLPNSIEGYGQAFVVSEDQKLDWGDMLLLLPRPVPHRNTRFWPAAPVSFTSTMDNYSAKLHEVTIKLLGLMAINLGINPQKLTGMFDDGAQGIRMNYYPPCLQANKVIGLAPHSDATGLTLLIQVNDVPGLQIKKDNKWIPIKPIPGAIIINIGDIMEIMSNGEYSSIEHRAVVNFQRERLSIAAFHSPNAGSKICPLPDLVKEDGANYRALDNEDYSKLVFSSKLAGKSLLDHMRLKE